MTALSLLVATATLPGWVWVAGCWLVVALGAGVLVGHTLGVLGGER